MQTAHTTQLLKKKILWTEAYLDISPKKTHI